MGNGDGNTLKDIMIASDGRSVNLRAEREGAGNGRVYTITVAVTDASGNRATTTFDVQVAKSQGKGAVKDAPVYRVTR